MPTYHRDVPQRDQREQLRQHRVVWSGRASCACVWWQRVAHVLPDSMNRHHELAQGATASLEHSGLIVRRDLPGEVGLSTLAQFRMRRSLAPRRKNCAYGLAWCYLEDAPDGS